MKPERIMKLRSICEKASRGPWRHEREDGEVDSFVLHKAAGFDDVIVCQVGAIFQSNYLDGDFIASCREALPELLDEVDYLRDELADSEAGGQDVLEHAADMLREGRRLEAEVKALREYVGLMMEQFDRVKGIAWAHGWRGDKDLWERAQPLRKLLGYEDV